MTSEVKTAITSFTLPTTSGNFDITAAGVTWQPKAMLIFLATTDETDVLDNGGGLGTWMAASNGRFGWGAGFRDGEVSVWANTYSSRDYLYYNESITGVRVNPRADFVSFITGGVRLNYPAGRQPDRGIRGYALFFGGADLVVSSGGLLMDVGGGVAKSFTVGHNFNLLLFTCPGRAGTQDSWDHSWRNRGNFSFGAAMNDGTLIQRSIGAQAAHNLGVGSRASVITAQHAVTRPTYNTYADITVSNWNGAAGASSSFDLTAVGTNDMLRVGYLALNTGDRRVNVQTLQAPTSAASDWNVTSIGFKPQIAMVGAGNSDTLEIFDNDPPENECHTLSMFNESAGGSCLWTSSASTVTTNERSVHSTRAIETRSYAGNFAVRHGMRNPVWTPTGFRFDAANIDAADSTQRLWVGVFIEEESAGISGTGDSTLAPLTAEGTGNVTTVTTGTGDSTLAALIAEGTGALTFTGMGDSTIAALIAEGVGAVIQPIFGAGNSVLGALISEGTGFVAQPVTGTGDSVLAALVGEGTGLVRLVATGDSQLASLIASGAGNVVLAEGYIIQRSPNGSTGWTEIDRVDVLRRTFQDTGLAANTEYFYRVALFRPGITSPWSNIDSARTSA